MADWSFPDLALALAFALIFLNLAFGIYRLVVGPHVVDRVVAVDLLTIASIAIIALLAHLAERFIYLDVALVYGLLSFLGVLAVARFLEKGF